MNRVEGARWAGLARAAVAEGRDATLVMAGSDRLPVGDPTLLMYDDNGRPTFIHPAHSQLTNAEGSQALLTLAVESTESAQLKVILGGLLTHVRQEPRWPFITVTALQVSRVAIQTNGQATSRPTLLRVPVSSYWSQEGDPPARRVDQRAS